MSTISGVGKIEDIKATALQELEASRTIEELERWRVAYLGRRGKLTLILRELGSLSPEERRSVGAAANEAKTLLDIPELLL